MELPRWAGEQFFAGGERMLSTHDAYAYLAGAVGVGDYTTSPLTLLVKHLSALTGAPLGTVGWWLPVVMGPLVAVPVVLMAHRLGHTWAGLVAGAWASIAPAFLMRSRVGYLDTDVWSLLFALAMAALVACMFLCRGRLLLWVAALVAVWHAYRVCYPSGMPISWAIIGCGAVGAALDREARTLMRSRWRTTLAVMVSMLVLAAWHGLDSGLAALAVKAPGQLLNGTAPLAEKLPSVLPSVRENAVFPWGRLIEMTAFHGSIAILGVAGCVWAMVKRPVLLAFLPLLLLGPAAAKLGIRYAMYAAPALGMGAALTLSRVLARSPRWRFVALGTLLCAVVGLGGQIAADNLTPKPVISRAYAEALIEAREHMPADAVLWQWWDYGYATQYFARRATYGDGGNHNGRLLINLARVHMAQTPQEASRVMAGTGREGPQYLAVSWDALPLSPWIHYFGTWDTGAGRGSFGRFEVKPGGQIEMDWRTYNSMMVRMLFDDPEDFMPDFEIVVDRTPWARVYRRVG
jgi:dolichyl-diphosphooligosaccharide--protein glycosyltransferase